MVRKKPFTLIAVILVIIIVLLSVNALINASRFIGNNFPGFLLYNPVIVSQVTLQHWAQQQDYGIKSYDKILAVDNKNITRSDEVYKIVSEEPVGKMISYKILRNDEIINIDIPSMQFTLIDMLSVFATQYISGLILFITGILVIIKRNDLISAKIFFLLCCIFSIWLIEDIDYQTTYSISYSFSIPYFAQTLTPSLWIILAMVFPTYKKFFEDRPFIFIIPIAISLSLFSLQYYYLNNPNVWKLMDLIILLYIVLGTGSVLLSVTYSYLKPINAIDKHRSGVVLLGSLFGFVVPAIGCVVIILMGYSNITYMALLVILFPLSIAYAIIKYKLFDIEVIIQQALVYTSLSGVLGLGIVLLIFLFNYMFASQGGWKNAGFFIVLSVFLVAALNPAKNKIQNIIDTAFFRKRYDYERTIYKLSEAMTSILKLEEISEKILGTIVETMQVNSVCLYLYNKNEDIFKIYKSTLANLYEAPLFSFNDKIISAFQKIKKEIFIEDLYVDQEYKDAKHELTIDFKKLDATIAFPLFFKDDLVGILFLGDKKSGLSYSSKDINLLKILANQSAIAIENAYSFKLIEDYANKLEETNRKLTETHLQLIQAEKMSAVGQLAAGIAHEIKNPLNIIEGARYYLSTEIDHGHNKDMVLEYLEYIKNQVKRTDRLINSLLDFSKPDDPSFKLIDLNRILDNAIVLMKKPLEDNYITLSLNLNESLPKIMGDQNQLWQVFINIMMNAVQAMPKGGHLLVQSDVVPDCKKKFVFVKFEDSGVGIERDNIGRVFDPFFTTKSKGHGLGLAICYKIIERHRGKIRVTSTKDIGSCFIISFPVSEYSET